MVCPRAWITMEGVSRPSMSNAVKYVFFANTVLIQIQYFLDQISILLLSLSKFSIAWNRRGFHQIYQARVLKLVTMIGFVLTTGQNSYEALEFWVWRDAINNKLPTTKAINDLLPNALHKEFKRQILLRMRFQSRQIEKLVWNQECARDACTHYTAPNWISIIVIERSSIFAGWFLNNLLFLFLFWFINKN